VLVLPVALHLNSLGGPDFVDLHEDVSLCPATWQAAGQRLCNKDALQRIADANIHRQAIEGFLVQPWAFPGLESSTRALASAVITAYDMLVAWALDQGCLYAHGFALLVSALRVHFLILIAGVVQDICGCVLFCVRKTLLRMLAPLTEAFSLMAGLCSRSRRERPVVPRKVLSVAPVPLNASAVRRRTRQALEALAESTQALAKAGLTPEDDNENRVRFRFAISCGFGIDSGTGAWPLQDSLRYVNSAPLYRKALCLFYPHTVFTALGICIAPEFDFYSLRRTAHADVNTMTEEDKSASSWYKVPTWNGNPADWRIFRREMKWWMASLDPEACKKFNVAARWALRQSGMVRARCEEFDPDELKGTEEVATVSDEGVRTVTTPADPFSGINKLLTALEETIGKTELDRKGELRAQFYQDIRRSPGERISTFCTRFRTLAADLKREGVDLPKEELGWFLKERMGLDALRKQLLDTALAGRESYDDVETESLRLFRDLHAADPLFKHRPGQDRPPLFSRFLAQSQSSSSQRTSALVTEAPAEEETQQDEDELIPDEGQADPSSLEDVLRSEVEVLAAELQELEEEGVDHGLMEELESGVEQAAESLLTMREARQRIAEVRKDRGFGKVSPTGGKGPGKAKGGDKKAASNCWDCGEQGHWQGDAQCKKPGQQLARPKGGGKRAPAKQVRVTETYNTEIEPADVPDGHEVMVASSIGHTAPLEDVLDGPKEALTMCSLATDKMLVGAL
ncbi:unnamed protein product, partial [Effrenium voratum]